MPAPRQRLQPTREDVAQAKTLLHNVPPLGLNWNSPPGREFLEFITGKVDEGIPVGWLADQLGLDSNRLYSVLARYRRTA